MNMYPCPHCKSYHLRGNAQFCIGYNVATPCQYCQRMQGRKCKRHAT